MVVESVSLLCLSRCLIVDPLSLLLVLLVFNGSLFINPLSCCCFCWYQRIFVHEPIEFGADSSFGIQSFFVHEPVEFSSSPVGVQRLFVRESVELAAAAAVGVQRLFAGRRIVFLVFWRAFIQYEGLRWGWLTGGRGGAGGGGGEAEIGGDRRRWKEEKEGGGEEEEGRRTRWVPFSREIVLSLSRIGLGRWGWLAPPRRVFMCLYVRQAGIS